MLKNWSIRFDSPSSVFSGVFNIHVYEITEAHKKYKECDNQ